MKITMLELALSAFATFFATISPIDTAVLFVTLTPRLSKAERRQIALKAALIATIIVLGLPCWANPSWKNWVCRLRR